jgi:hypothetical protein
MRPYILLLVVLTSACRDGTQLREVTKCGLPCWDLKIGQAGVGQCKSGTWACVDDEESTATCEGQVGPSKEACDLVDNNCDGRVDEGVTRECLNYCGTGRETCMAGAFVGCTAPTPAPEVCDGKDNDCDGRYDEPEELPLEFCYSGPQGSAQFGECRPGVLRCELGLKSCVGENTPKPEACNGKDDDCDGSIDEGSGNTDPVDIVFVIDNSGSMGNTIAAVKAAVNGFANTYGARVDLRWGLVVAPDPDPFYDAQVRRYSDLNTATIFAGAMQAMGSNGGGQEPTLDAIQDLADPLNPLQMGWRSGSRHVVVVFTDENPQSYRTPQNTVLTVYAAIQATQTRVYVFTDTYQNSVWQPALPTGWGQLRVLTSVASVMESELSTVIQEVSCR